MSEADAAMGGSVIYVVVDTNIFLHFQPLENLPWAELCGETVVLVICSHVIRELNTHKDRATDSAKRDRARRGLALARGASGVQLPAGVTVQTLPMEPPDEWFASGLSRGEPDDVILAAGVGIMRERPGEDVRMLSDDVGPILKAPMIGLTAMELPERYRIPPTVDPHDAELRRLQAEVTSLKKAIPRPKLTFEDGDASYACQVPEPKFLGPIPDPPEQALAGLRPMELPSNDATGSRQAVPTGDDPLTGILRMAASARRQFEALVAPTVEQVQDYNREVERFCTAYPSAYEKWQEYRDAMSRLFVFQVVLENAGSAPAQDVDAYLRIAPKHADDWLFVTPQACPRPPVVPTRPRLSTRFDAALGHDRSPTSSLLLPTGPHLPGLDGGRRWTHWLVPSPPGPSPRFVIHDDEGQYIRFGHEKLKHGFNISFGPFAVRRVRGDARGCSLEFTIHADNMPEPAVGRLTLRQKRPDEIS